MARNEYGFVCKRYIQPDYYRNIFGCFNAVYILPDESKAMIEARPHHLCSERLGAEIDHYQVLVQEPDCRRVVRSGLKTQKAAFEVLERLINKAKGWK